MAKACTLAVSQVSSSSEVSQRIALALVVGCSAGRCGLR